MTLYQFNTLQEKEQAKAIVERGVSIGKRTARHHDFELKQIDSFYVETKFLKGDTFNMLSFKTFQSLDLLGPYVDQVDISFINA